MLGPVPRVTETAGVQELVTAAAAWAFPVNWLVLQLLERLLLRSRPYLSPDIVVKLELDAEFPPTNDLLCCYACDDTVCCG